jgi:hypothetical protein
MADISLFFQNRSSSRFKPEKSGSEEERQEKEIDPTSTPLFCSS